MALNGFKHFFVDRPLDTSRLTVKGVGVAERMKPSIINRPRGKEDWLFMLFYDPVTLGTPDGERSVAPCTMMVWNPGLPQFYGRRDGAWRHTWIHCDGSHVRKLVRSLRMPIGKPIAAIDPASAEQHLLALHDELTAHRRPDERIACNLLENWLRRVRRQIDRPSDDAVVPQSFVELRRYIEANYAQPIRLRELARRAHLSVPYLCARFKQHFGSAPIDYVIRLRLSHAAHLLADRNLTVTQVAAMVGYDDLYHFSKLFKTHYGVSPRAIR